MLSISLEELQHPFRHQNRFTPHGGLGGKGLWCLKGRFHAPLDFDNIKCSQYPMKVCKTFTSNIYQNNNQKKRYKKEQILIFFYSKVDDDRQVKSLCVPPSVRPLVTGDCVMPT